MRYRRASCAAAVFCAFVFTGFAPAPSEDWGRHVIAENFHTFTASVADVNGDGRLDVLANGIDERKRAIDVLFVSPGWNRVVLHEGTEATHALVMDVNEDGRPDYVSSRFSPGLLYWLERPASPQTEPWRFHLIDDAAQAGVDGVHGLAVADVDGDGHPDLIANSALKGGGAPESLVWFSGPELKRRHVIAGHADGLTHYIGVGDVNGDGRLDIATGAKAGNWFAWWEAPKDRTRLWTRHPIATGEEGATNILIADMNGDGRPDFVASHGHGKGLVWFEAPKWTRHEFGTELNGPHSLAMGDLNGDGIADIVTCAKDSKQVVWFENDGRGDLREHLIDQGQAAYELQLADMDGDGDLDIVIAGQESRNLVWFENRMRRAGGATH